MEVFIPLLSQGKNYASFYSRSILHHGCVVMTTMMSFEHPTAWPDAPPPPEGFRAFNISKIGGFVAVNGPVFYKKDTDRMICGAWLSERHNNGAHITHGGWMASLMDISLPSCALYKLNSRPSRVVTVNLSLDFMAVGRPGDWIEVHVDLLKETASLLFVQGMMSTNGTPLLRGSCVLKKIYDRKPAPEPEVKTP